MPTLAITGPFVGSASTPSSWLATSVIVSRRALVPSALVDPPPGRAMSRKEITPDTCDARCALRYTWIVIKSFKHKGLRQLFESGRTAGVQPNHAKRLRLQPAALDSAYTIDDMQMPGWRLHPLKGELAGRWAITVNGNWRLTFEFRDGNAYVWDYEDYH